MCQLKLVHESACSCINLTILVDIWQEEVFCFIQSLIFFTLVYWQVRKGLFQRIPDPPKYPEKILFCGWRRDIDDMIMVSLSLFLSVEYKYFIHQVVNLLMQYALCIE